MEATLETFLQDVRAEAKKMAQVEHRIWYRGLSNNKYQLLPSLFRKPSKPVQTEGVSMDRRQQEKNLFARFKTQAGQLLPAPLHSSWEVLSLMQHHGFPTRMMDWTTSLFTAAYFALEYESDPESPCLWLLNPFKLNKTAFGRSVIFDQVDRLPEEAYEDFIKEPIESSATSAIANAGQTWPAQFPVASNPIWCHPRVLRQNGVFTIHGTDERPLDEQGQDLVTQIVIPKELHDSLRQLLREAGLDHYSLFPDLDGLARALRKRYGWS
jgi:hypothetical protein